MNFALIYELLDEIVVSLCAATYFAFNIRKDGPSLKPALFQISPRGQLLWSDCEEVYVNISI